MRCSVVFAGHGLQFFHIALAGGDGYLLRQQHEHARGLDQLRCIALTRSLRHEIPADLDALVVDAEHRFERNSFASPLAGLGAKLGQVGFRRGAALVEHLDRDADAFDGEFGDVAVELFAWQRPAGSVGCEVSYQEPRHRAEIAKRSRRRLTRDHDSEASRVVNGHRSTLRVGSSGHTDCKLTGAYQRASMAQCKQSNLKPRRFRTSSLFPGL